jgi:hypothetical protein
MEFILLALAVLLGIAFSISLLNKLCRQRNRELLERSAPLRDPEFDFSRLDSSENSHVNSPGSQALSLPLGEDSQETAPSTLAELVPLIRQLRESGELDKARNLCEQHLPKIQAFQQLLMTRRMMLKSQIQQNKDASDSLTLLYKTAVLAELYRSSKAIPALIQQPRYAAILLDRFTPDYQQLGYARLRGLNRADMALLVRCWGEPQHHVHPVLALPADWWKSETNQPPATV